MGADDRRAAQAGYHVSRRRHCLCPLGRARRLGHPLRDHVACPGQPCGVALHVGDVYGHADRRRDLCRRPRVLPERVLPEWECQRGQRADAVRCAGEGDAGCGRRPAAGRDRFGQQRDVHPAGRHPVHLPRVWRGPDGHGAQVDSSSHNLWVDDSTTSSTGSTNNYCIQGASSGSDLKATLVWSDKPGSPSSGVALVNDLTLFMGTDDNTVTGNWRNKKDTRNTVEVATIAASQISSGTEYKIQVKGVNVPSGPQKYALVITGSFPSVSPSGCTYEFADTLEDQSDSESFPLGPAVGIGAAGLAGGLLAMLSLLFFKDKTTLPRLCAAFQGAQGGGGGH